MINKTLKRHGSDAKPPTKNLMVQFDAMQEELLTEEEMARHNNAEVKPPAWWATLWCTTEMKKDENARGITNRMDKMFIVQTQRMDSLEARLEAEAQRAKRMLNGLEEKFIEQQESREAEKKMLEKNLHGIDEHIRNLEVGQASGGNERIEQVMARLESLESRDASNEGDGKIKGGSDENKAERSHNLWVPTHIVQRGWPPKAPRSTIEKKVRELLAKQGGEIRRGQIGAGGSGASIERSADEGDDRKPPQKQRSEH